MYSRLFVTCLLMIAVAVVEAKSPFKRRLHGYRNVPTPTTGPISCPTAAPISCPNQHPHRCIAYTDLCNGVSNCENGHDENPVLCAQPVTCPSGFSMRSDRCYARSTETMSWHSASHRCASLADGAHLIFINTREEQAVVETMIGSQSETQLWIGGEREGVSQWTWKAYSHNGTLTSTASMTYTNWGPSEPNNSDGRESCVVLMHMSWWNARWNDDVCSKLKHFICEFDVDG